MSKTTLETTDFHYGEKQQQQQNQTNESHMRHLKKYILIWPIGYGFNFWIMKNKDVRHFIMQNYEGYGKVLL